MQDFVTERLDYVAKEYRSAQINFRAIKTSAHRILYWLMKRRTARNYTTAMVNNAWQGR